MKKHILFLFTVMFVSLMSQAQNSKVTSGAIAYDSQRYEEAIEKLEEALSQKEDLKEKNLPKAYFYLAQAYAAVAQDTTLAGKYDNPVEKAYENYLLAKETDTNGKYEKTMILLEQNLYPTLFNVGAEAYGTDEYATAESMFSKATELSPEDHTSFLMLGFANWMQQDSAEAYTALEKATTLYKENPPEEEMPQIAQAYLMMATIENQKGNAREAIDILQQGQELFPANKDLSNTELSIYQTNPELATEALAKFEKAIQEDPDNTTLKLAYADMLAKSGQTEASREIYKQILEKDPDNINANIQLGAKYINNAVELSKKRSESTNEEVIDSLQTQIVEQMKLALPYMEKLHELEPDEPEWINQLVSIAYYLEFPDEKIAELEEKSKEVNAKNNQSQE